MKIEDSGKKIAGPGLAGGPARTTKKAESPSIAHTGPSGGEVRISTEMKELSGKLASGGVFDAKKVEEIKSAIASGKFQVNAEKVAEGLIDTVRDLIKRR